MSSRVQTMGSAPFPDRALLDALLEIRAVHDALDEDAGRVDLVGVDLAGLDEILDLGDGDARRGRQARVEVARRLAVDEVALGIALPGMHDGEIGEDAALHDVALAVERALLLALGDVGADAGLGEEGGNAGAAGADALGEGALRVELDLELAAEIELGEALVLADIGRDHLLDLSALEQQAESGAVDPGIVRDDGQPLDAGLLDRIDQLLRNAAQAEAAR